MRTAIIIVVLLKLADFAWDVSALCEISNHYTDLKFTCCGKERLENGLDLSLKQFQNCPTLREETIVISAWKAFSCIVQSQLGGKSLTLANFADLMTSKYPEHIKSKIKAGLPTEIPAMIYGQEHIPEDLRPLAGIRQAYFLSEIQVCETLGGMTSENFTKLPSRCFTWYERYNMNGDCCRQAPIPFELTPDPWISKYDALNFTATFLMPIIGTYTFKNVTYSYNLEPCIRLAKLILGEYLSVGSLRDQVNNLEEPNYEGISDKIIPPFLNQHIRDDMKDFMKVNISQVPGVKLVNEQTMEAYISTFEFSSLDANKTKYLYMACAVSTVLSVRSRDYNFTQWCYENEPQLPATTTSLPEK